jgi:hypothetical protein
MKTMQSFGYFLVSLGMTIWVSIPLLQGACPRGDLFSLSRLCWMSRGNHFVQHGSVNFCLMPCWKSRARVKTYRLQHGIGVLAVQFPSSQCQTTILVPWVLNPFDQLLNDLCYFLSFFFHHVHIICYDIELGATLFLNETVALMGPKVTRSTNLWWMSHEEVSGGMRKHTSKTPSRQRMRSRLSIHMDMRHGNEWEGNEVMDVRNGVLLHTCRARKPHGGSPDGVGPVSGG